MWGGLKHRYGVGWGECSTLARANSFDSAQGSGDILAFGRVVEHASLRRPKTNAKERGQLPHRERSVVDVIVPTHVGGHFYLTTECADRFKATCNRASWPWEARRIKVLNNHRPVRVCLALGVFV